MPAFPDWVKCPFTKHTSTKKCLQNNYKSTDQNDILKALRFTSNNNFNEEYWQIKIIAVCCWLQVTSSLFFLIKKDKSTSERNFLHIVTVLTSEHKYKQTSPISIIKFLHRLFAVKIAHERPQLRRYGAMITRCGGGGGEPDLRHRVLDAARQTATRGFNGRANRLTMAAITCGYHERCWHCNDTCIRTRLYGYAGTENLHYTSPRKHKHLFSVHLQPAS